MTGDARNNDPADNAYEALLEALQQGSASADLSDEEFEQLLREFKTLGSPHGAADEKTSAISANEAAYDKQHQRAATHIARTPFNDMYDLAVAIMHECRQLQDTKNDTISARHTQAVDNMLSLLLNFQLLAHKDSENYAILFMLEKQLFALPLSCIAEILSGAIALQRRHDVWTLVHNEKPLPLLDLSTIMHNRQQPSHRDVYLLLHNETHQYAIGVDAVLGFERIKPGAVSQFASEQALVSGIYATVSGLNVLLLNNRVLAASPPGP